MHIICIICNIMHVVKCSSVKNNNARIRHAFVARGFPMHAIGLNAADSVIYNTARACFVHFCTGTPHVLYTLKYGTFYVNVPNHSEPFALPCCFFGSGSDLMSLLIFLFMLFFFFLLGRPLQEALRLRFKRDRYEIWRDCWVLQLNPRRLKESDFWYDVIISRWRPWSHFTQKSAAAWWTNTQRLLASMQQRSPGPDV